MPNARGLESIDRHPPNERYRSSELLHPTSVRQPRPPISRRSRPTALRGSLSADGRRPLSSTTGRLIRGIACCRSDFRSEDASSRTVAAADTGVFGDNSPLDNGLWGRSHGPGLRAGGSRRDGLCLRPLGSDLWDADLDGSPQVACVVLGYPARRLGGAGGRRGHCVPSEARADVHD